MPVVVRWALCYGPNSSHLIECKIFNRLKDAKMFLSEIKADRAYRLERLEFPTPYGTGKNKKVIMERVI